MNFSFGGWLCGVILIIFNQMSSVSVLFCFFLQGKVHPKLTSVADLPPFFFIFPRKIPVGSCV